MFEIVDKTRNNTRTVDTRAEAQDAKSDLEALGADVEIRDLTGAEPEGEPVNDGDAEIVNPDTVLPDESPGVETDPLDILPEYMIDHVQGEPTLNKRGLSVLAYHYGITVTNRELVVTPHESDWEYAIVETTVKNEDGNTFVGTGTAHVDRGDEKGVLLEMAETRSYKRAVSFATGTGIVSYQEMVNTLE